MCAACRRAAAGCRDRRRPGGPGHRQGAVRPVRRGHAAGAGRRGGGPRQRRGRHEGPGENVRRASTGLDGHRSSGDAIRRCYQGCRRLSVCMRCTESHKMRYAAVHYWCAEVHRLRLPMWRPSKPARCFWTCLCCGCPLRVAVMRCLGDSACSPTLSQLRWLMLRDHR